MVEHFLSAPRRGSGSYQCQRKKAFEFIVESYQTLYLLYYAKNYPKVALKLINNIIIKNFIHKSIYAKLGFGARVPA
jgi:hypothetical protein